ncbi:MAG: RDD family protein [Pseudobdellovibrionaceae bacterium]
MAQVMYTARTGRRLMAFGVDSMIQGLCFLPLWIHVVASVLDEQLLIVDFRWLALCLLLILFYKWMFLYFLGGTLGKLIFGLRVVPRHHPGEGLGLVQSFLRVLTDSLSLFFGHSLRALALLRLDRTHVSDWVAETRVVQWTQPKDILRRHWILASAIIFFSFTHQFSSLYRSVQNATLTKGQVIFHFPPPF